MYVEDDGHTAPIEREIRALSAALEAVKDEQEYIVVRERLHRNSSSTLSSPNVNKLSFPCSISGGKYKRQSKMVEYHANLYAVWRLWVADILS